jgi:phage-related tail protein
MDLKLSVLLSAIDRATAPLRAIAGSSSTTSKALRETRQRLKELEKAQGELKGFRALKAGTQQLAMQMHAARSRATELGKAIAATTAPTRAQRREFEAARRQADALSKQYQLQMRRLQSMRTTLSAAGMDTRKLAQHERQLRDAIAASTQQMEAQQRQLQKLTQQQQRMGAARAALSRGQALGSHTAVGGLAAMATGQHVLDALSPAMEEAKAFQTQMAQWRAMGVGDATVAEAVTFARGTDIMGTSATENLKLLKESYGVLRDMHESEQVAPTLARMKFGIETVMANAGHGEGHGEHAEAMFMDLLKVAELRGAAKDPARLKQVLDFATQAYVVSGGLVKPDDLLNMIKTGGIAAKQLDDTPFFFGMLHTMQEMGGHRAGTGLATAYQNWAAGRSTQQAAEELQQLGLLNKDAIQYGKTGHIKKMLPDALKDGDLYRTNPFEYLMTRVVPTLNPTGKLTDQQVVSKINNLFSGRKGGDLFASLYLERANIAKHLAAAPKAYGVNALYDEAKQTAAGQEAELLARKSDLYRELGTQLLPLYVSGLQTLTGAVRHLTTWNQSHPRLAKGILVVAGSLGVLMTAIGGVMVGLGGLVGQFAMLRFLLRMGGLTLGGGGGVGLARLFPLLISGARAAAMAVMGLSAPMLALIALIAIAAVVVTQYWGPIRAWVQGVGQGIAQTVGPAFQRLGAALHGVFAPLATMLATVWGWVSQLWQPFQATSQQLDAARQNGVAFGTRVGQSIAAVIDAITLAVRAFVWLGEAIGTAAGWAVTQWAPVKAWFVALWQTIENAARKTLDGIADKLQGVRDLIARIRGLGNSPAPASGVPIEWIMPGDRERARQVAETIGRTPMAGRDAAGTGQGAINSAGPMGARAGAGSTVHVHIDARGAEPSHVKRAVQDALNDHARSQRARAHSSYSDEG